MAIGSRIAAAGLTLAALGGAAGCGSSDSSSGAAATTAPPAQTTVTAASVTPSHALTVRMSEFAFDPKDAVAKAGKVTITAPNGGNVPHELVVLRTSADPANLPMKGGEVDESSSVGEIADVKPVATKSTSLRLKAGRYVMVCNLPGHYKSGMYGTLTVK